MLILAAVLLCQPVAPSGPQAAAESAPDQGAEPASGPALKLPEGFVADLVATAPELRWPSAVHCLDDGSLLVAEDPMDMVGPPDRPIDRILRLDFDEGDGLGGYTQTVFADGLFAVFGITSIGTEVFVVNMPHLTRLIDADGDGVAEQRDVLVEGLGPQPPGMEGGFNDHAISGIELGLDGWLYISVGDKGIPLATGTDGSSLTLRGGGLIRVKPDGTQLELVASGTRNHLDVVHDERGNLFTYDNTDDGLGWWARVTHIVEDGYYGYPYDYLEHPERMLPCMADYGSGAPAGGLCYREDTWPVLYRGSFFWCEWGKRAIERFDFEPDEGTFKVDLKLDFATAAGDFEFRPLDLCLSPDGRFMYVADWAHAGWMDDEVTGRLWRIRLETDPPDTPTRLRPPPKTLTGWIEELGSESLRVRQRAQRWLVRNAGAPIRTELIQVLALNPVERRRRHALWALSELGGDLARAAIEGALEYPNQDTRIQALRALRRRGRKLPEAVLGLLVDPSAQVRHEAATTAGYLGEAPDAARMVRRLQHEDDPWVRWAIARALRRIGVWDERVLSWLHFTSDSQDELLLALRGVRDLQAVERLAWFASGTGGDWSAGWANRLADARARALEVLSDVHRLEPPWDGSWWSTQPAKGAPPPKTVDWEGTELVLAAVRAALGDPTEPVRRAGLEAVRRIGDRGSLTAVRARYEAESSPAMKRLVLEVLADLRDEGAVEFLASIVRDPAAAEEQRALAVDTAARIASPGMQAFLLEVVRADELPLATVVSAADALAELGLESAVPVLVECLEHPAEPLRAAALRGLAALTGALAEPHLRAAFDDPSLSVRREAIRLTASLGLVGSVGELLERSADPTVREACFAALARMPDPRALDLFLAGLGQVATRTAAREALRQIREEVVGELEQRHTQGLLVEPLLSDVRALYREPRPVRDWLIAGPYRRGSGVPVFDGPHFLRRLDGEGAAPVDPGDPGDSVDSLAQPVWRSHRAAPETGFVDLDELLTTELNREAWATASFGLSHGGELDLLLGSDDSVAVWIDGELVHEYDGARAWGPAQDRVRLSLEAGEHELLVHIGQGVGDWAFSCATVGPESRVLFRDSGLTDDRDELREYLDFAVEHPGDLARGFRLYQDTRRLGCVRCHRVSTARGMLGERVGPDFDGIGARYGRRQLATSILKPSALIASGYETWRIWTHDGRQLAGQILKEDERRLLLVDSSGEQHLVRRYEIEGRSPMDASVMPDGYQKLMSKEELADLVTFLQSLGGGAEGQAEEPGQPKRTR